MIRRLHLTLALVLVLVLTLAGVGRAAGPTKEECALAGIKNPAQLTSFIANLQKAVKSGDKAAVANMVDYPIEVKLGGAERSIENQADFINNYDAIMIKAVREAVLNQKMTDIFINRKGVMLTDGTGEGRIWLAVASGSLRIITIIN